MAAKEAASPEPAPGAGCETSAPTTMVGVLALLGATQGMSCDFATEVQPPSLALTFIQTFEMYCGDADMTCLAWRTCEGTPKRISHDFLMRR